MEPEILYILGLALLVGGGLGWVIGRLWGGTGAAVLVVVLLVAVGVLAAMGQRAPGWDGIAYAVLAFLFAAPAALGALLGGWLGTRRRNRRRQRRAAQQADAP
ncbi:hypothetical protein JI664_00320 [Rhodobacter sp. NTK016B]|uniref:hypothetical protein n=1 Tax=Rhodobacter sp. NTK016B TaxID=2759676 RepID=UPI001A8C5E3C|nr:hypothetical protein [Rhodobacter sp. NTK016B]MBN8290400.1 hypothetical protein [Rhodobacter sp. NTK016B]